MTGTVSAAISNEPVLQPNPLASVTSHYIVIRNTDRRTTMIIPLARLASIQRVNRRYSVLLVISIAALVVAAAAYTSREAAGAPLPLTLIGLFLLGVYFESRKTLVTLLLDSGAAETLIGDLAEARALVMLIELAQQAH